jgi:dipeptidase
MKRSIPAGLYILFMVLFFSPSLRADCTSILVSKGASSDGSIMITYSADLGGMLSRLYFVPEADHEEGETAETFTWTYGVVRQKDVAQVPHTYRVIGLMNEHQVTIGETTTGGRSELNNKDGMLDYEDVMILALQRSRTAREAIRVIDELVNAHGYKGPAETFSIADKHEAWMMEIIGKGPGVKGALWVAARIPEGFISCHANMSRITAFPMDDPDNWLYSPDVVDFAAEKGYYDPDSGRPFSFRQAYHPLKPRSMRVCASRVWSVYRRSAPSMHFPDDYHRGVQGAEDYPLFIKPDNKLSVRDVMGLMRDHFEGTPYDMTKGIDAGPFSSPYRFRNLTWEVDGETYCWERPISSQQAGFVMVTQSRSWLPDPVGGIYWYSPDDAFTSCFAPFFCGMTEAPRSFLIGDIEQFSWDSAWWVFNFVSKLKVQKEMEDSFFEMLPAIEKTAGELHEKNPELMKQFLTTFSVSTAERLVARWRELGAFILTRHNDGYIREPGKGSKGIGYPEAWLRRVLKEKPDQFSLPKWSELQQRP